MPAEENGDDGESQLVSSEADMQELMGLYDAPAFSRRGQDLEFALARLHERCRTAREERLEMVRMRLRQWAAVADGPSAALLVFRSSIDALWPLCEVEPPDRWSAIPPTPRRLRATARELVASVERFNRRWTDHVNGLVVDNLNQMIDHYNRYYLLEKECVLGSPRLAARYFVARKRISSDSLLADYPSLPIPEWKEKRT